MSCGSVAAAARLTDLARSLGAVLGPPPGRAAGACLPLAYGDPAAEYRALRQGAALRLRPEAERLVLAGADRERFLNGLLTCDVKALRPGEGAYGYFTNAQGRILADAVVSAGEASLRVEVPPGAGERLLAHLLAYRVADRVEAAREAGMASLALVGPAAPARWPALGGEPPSRWGNRTVVVAGVAVEVANRPLDGAPGLVAWGPEEALPAVASELLRLPGVLAAGELAAAAVRIEEGCPLCGEDYPPAGRGPGSPPAAALPQELGCEEAMSFTKGCYLGQEVVARIRYRGKVNRLLRGLYLAAEPDAPTDLLHGGEGVGRLGSWARSPESGRWVGLALLHRKGAEPGAVLQLAGGGEARVAALPLRDA